MTKYISLLLLTLCAVGLLTGCVESDIGVRLYANESGSVTTTIGIEEEVYDQFVEMGAVMFEGKETTTYEHDGKTYVAYTEAAEYKTFEEIEQALLDLTFDSDEYTNMEDDSEPEQVEAATADRIFKAVEIEKKTGLFYTEYSFQAELNVPEDTEDDAESAPDLFTDNMLRMTFSVEMPDEITQANGGTVAENKVTFEIEDFTEAATFSVVSEESNVVPVVAIVLALVTLLVIFVMCLKRKNEQ